MPYRAATFTTILAEFIYGGKVTPYLLEQASWAPSDQETAMTLRTAAIPLLSLVAIPLARAREIKVMDNSSPQLTLKDVGSVSPTLEAYTQNRRVGDLWKRPDFTPRDRSIVTLAAPYRNRRRSRHQAVLSFDRAGARLDRKSSSPISIRAGARRFTACYKRRCLISAAMRNNPPNNNLPNNKSGTRT
jgi:hypothetical protein